VRCGCRLGRGCCSGCGDTPPNCNTGRGSDQNITGRSCPCSVANARTVHAVTMTVPATRGTSVAPQVAFSSNSVGFARLTSHPREPRPLLYCTVQNWGRGRGWRLAGRLRSQRCGCANNGCGCCMRCGCRSRGGDCVRRCCRTRCGCHGGCRCRQCGRVHRAVTAPPPSIAQAASIPPAAPPIPTAVPDRMARAVAPAEIQVHLADVAPHHPTSKPPRAVLLPCKGRRCCRSWCPCHRCCSVRRGKDGL